MIRDTEVLVYAVGIDGQSETTFGRPRSTPPVMRPPPRMPYPFPPGGGRGTPWPQGPTIPGTGGPTGRRGGGWSSSADERVNVGALRELTDDSGGRTEIVRSARDLDPATASIADELSKQYYLGYPAPGPSRRTLAHHPRRAEQARLHRARPARLHGDALTASADSPRPRATRRSALDACAPDSSRWIVDHRSDAVLSTHPTSSPEHTPERRPESRPETAPDDADRVGTALAMQ